VRIKQVVNAFADAFDVTFDSTEGNHSAMIEGRVANFTLGGIAAGIMGEIHPASLSSSGSRCLSRTPN